MHPTDYKTARHFLSPQGTLFKLISRLLADQDATFQYPFTGLPVGCFDVTHYNLSSYCLVNNKFSAKIFKDSLRCDALRVLISFVQFKKREKHSWRSVTFSSKVVSFFCFTLRKPFSI